MSDCVILLDHRVQEEVATRRLRIVKYRGTAHGTNEFPFLIDHNGITVLPVTTLNLTHAAPEEKISCGVAGIDGMLGGGLWRGSGTLISGMAGTGKTTLAAFFVDAACRRGERAAFFSFEESQQQVLRNMRSVGLDLQRWVEAGLLRFSAARPSVWGLEMHLARMHDLLDHFAPSVAVIDPIYNMGSVGTNGEVRSMLLRLVDFLKSRQISALFTAIQAGDRSDRFEDGVSSLMDNWIHLQTLEANGERNRGLYVLKARGIAHSNQIREFLLTDHGIQLRDVYLGLSGLLTGAARVAQEARDAEALVEQAERAAARKLELELNRRRIEAQIAILQAELESQRSEESLFTDGCRFSAEALAEAHRRIAAIRGESR